MDKAINLSRANLQGISDEITYLRQQLLIGGSSLDSILRAEARLYEAEADLINFEAQKRLAKLSVIAALGLFFN
jgi:outer membrane protein TolC